MAGLLLSPRLQTLQTVKLDQKTDDLAVSRTVEIRRCVGVCVVCRTEGDKKGVGVLCNTRPAAAMHQLIAGVSLPSLQRETVVGFNTSKRR